MPQDVTFGDGQERRTDWQSAWAHGQRLRAESRRLLARYWRAVDEERQEILLARLRIERIHRELAVSNQRAAPSAG